MIRGRGSLHANLTEQQQIVNTEEICGCVFVAGLAVIRNKLNVVVIRLYKDVAKVVYNSNKEINKP